MNHHRFTNEGGLLQMSRILQYSISLFFQLQMLKGPWRRLALYVMFFVVSVNGSYGQQAANLTIKISLSNRLPASYAKIQMVDLKDLTVVNQIADENGTGIINLAKTEKFRLIVQYLGYKDFLQNFETSKLTEPELDIILEPAKIALGEVVVKSNRPLIERSGDKLILNVSSIVELGTEVPLLEILNYAPGVIIDNGTIILNGKPGVKVTIDGRDQPNLSTNILNGILSSNIRNIEIIQNPSSQYDAAGAAGIINIVTKKNLGKLLLNTTTTSLSHAKRPSYSLSNSLIVSTDKLLINQSLSFQQTRSISEKFYSQNNNLSNGFTKLTEFSNDSIDVIYPAGSLDIDFLASRKHTITGGVTAFGSQRNSTQLSTQNLEISGVPNQNLDFSGLTKAKIFNSATYLGLTTKLDTNGSNRKLFLNYTSFENSSRISNASEILNSRDLTNGRIKNSISLFTANLDYLKILNRYSSLKYGLKYAISTVGNFSDYKYSVDNLTSTDFQDFSFSEGISAGYLDYSHRLRNFDYTFGLRAEFTDFENSYKQNQLGERVIENSYLSIFPSFNVNYTRNPDHIFSFFGGRRINRPLYDFLSPFIQVRNNYSYSQGNPDLKPMYAYNLGISYLIKQQYSVSLSYANIDQVFASIQSFDPVTNNVVYTIGNLNSQQDLSLSLSLPFVLGEKINLTPSINMFYNKFKSPDQYSQLSRTGKGAFNTFISARFRPTNKLTLSSTFYYFTGSYQSQLRSFPRSYLNLTTRYSLIPNRASLTFSINDLFYKNNYREQFSFEQSAIESYNRSDTRSVQLGFAYRFGKLKPERELTSKPQNEENSRIKTQ